MPNTASSPMRHIQRLIAASILVALCGTLSGCGGGNSATSFDPMDMLDFLDQKKPLQGTRKPVFPEGVPGVAQGVPKELYKGNQAQQQDVPPVTAPPAPEPKNVASTPHLRSQLPRRLSLAPRLMRTHQLRQRRQSRPNASAPARPLFRATRRLRSRLRRSSSNNRSSRCRHSRRHCRAAVSSASRLTGRPSAYFAK